MSANPSTTRRQILGWASLLGARSAGFGQDARPRIATVITEYRHNSHADVIVGRLLGGYEFGGARRKPAVKVVSMYTDQVPKNDMSRDLAAKYGFPIFPSIRQSLTLGGEALAVDGVVLIGEHGNYPNNEKGQKLYPRYELYKQIIDVFKSSGKTVPVFTDKHLSVEWDKAKWMYDQSRELGFPLLAGSSVPVSWRHPSIDLPFGAPVKNAVSTFYGGKEAYGFHALEALQCFIERRKGGETGIEAVTCLEGDDVWKWGESNAWGPRLMDAAVQRISSAKPGSVRNNVKQPILFLLDYKDGLKAAVYLLNGHIAQAAVAADTGKEIVATEMWLQEGRPFSHFSALTDHVEQLIVKRRAPYPVERTLLTTGALAALMDASYQKKGRLLTPHLGITYKTPRESFFARGPVPARSETPIG